VNGQPDPAGGLRSRELEAKLIAPDELRLPDLRRPWSRERPRCGLPGRHLEATYYDTAELRLARNGITLRYRSGEDGPPWTGENSLRAAPPQRSAAARSASTVAPGPVPPRAADLVRAYARSCPLVPVAHLHTDRAPIEICGPNGGLLAEITDDRVAVYDEHGQRTGGFREIEVEVRAKGRAGRRLLRAGDQPAGRGRLPG